MSIDRDEAFARRRQQAQWAGAVLVGVVLFTVPGLGGAYYLLEPLSAATGVSLWVLSLIPSALAGGAAGLLMRAVLRRPRGGRLAVTGAILVSAGAIVQVGVGIDFGAVGGGILAAWPLAFIVIVSGAVLCLTVWIRSAPSSATELGEGAGGVSATSARLWAATALASAACLGTLALVTVDALVWGPRSQTGGLELGEIFARLSEGDVASARGGLIVGLVLAIALCAAPWGVAALMRRSPVRDARRMVAAAALVAIGGIVVAQTLGTFSLGMSIADTLPPYTGSQSPQWMVFFPLGGLLACVGVTLALGWARVPDSSAPSARGLREPAPIA
ncbi:MAG: hypothetical protein ACXIUP_08580 [Microcella sp.]